MNVKVNGGFIDVTLSRRNLKTLLLKLDEPSSERTLVRFVAQADGSRVALYVKAEEDDIHYGDRTPGPVHPREEERL